MVMVQRCLSQAEGGEAQMRESGGRGVSLLVGVQEREDHCFQWQY